MDCPCDQAGQLRLERPAAIVGIEVATATWPRGSVAALLLRLCGINAASVRIISARRAANTNAGSTRVRRMRPEYDFSKGERGRFFHRRAKLNLPLQGVVPDWAGPDGDLGAYVTEESRRTFTSVMREIGLTRRQGEDEPFLIGLTATPYRGHDEEETARLVTRYGRQRLDAGAFPSDDPEDVVSELQNMHVLALADHRTIDGGHFSLNEDELAEMTREPRPPWLPRSVEDRIARDSARTTESLTRTRSRSTGSIRTGPSSSSPPR